MSRLYGVFYGLNMHTHPNEQQINRKSYAHQILPQPIENKFDHWVTIFIFPLDRCKLMPLRYYFTETRTMALDKTIFT